MNNRIDRPLLWGLCFFAFASSAIFASTAVTQWQQVFHPAANGTTSAAPIAARELADGTVLVVTQDFQTLHYNHDGTIVSFKQLSLTPPHERPEARRRGTAALPEAGPGGVVNSHAVIDGFGRVVLSTVASSGNIPRDAGIAETMKFDGLTGDPLWASPVYYNSHVAETPLAVYLDSSGDVVLTTGANGNQRHTTLKYDGRNGSVLWGPKIIDSVTFPSAQTTSAMDLAGNVYVSVPSGFPEVGVATLKYAGTDGTILWGPALYADGTALPGASVVDPDGDFVVAGGSDSGLFALRYDGESGALLWGPSVFPVPPGSGGALAQSVVANLSGAVFVSGRFDPPGTGPELVSFGLARSTGAMLWSSSPIGTFAESQPVQSALASNGDLILGGILGPSVAPHVDFWRYRGPDGALEWGPTTFGPIAIFDPPAFFVGANGRIFTSELVGQGLGAALNSGEIDGQSGVTAWGPTPADFPHADVTFFTSLAAGPDGDPVVVGLSSGSTHQIQTLKYDRPTGAVVWGPVVFAPEDTYVNPWQVAVDANSDVFLLGFEQSLIDTSQYGTFLIKYSGSSGDVLWGPTILSTLAPQAIALDASGDAVVLDWSQDPTSFATHAATAKISGTNGSILWGPIPFVGDPQGNDYADFVSLDASGNAFVVGETTAGGESWFVLKYAAADGSLLLGPVFPSAGQPKGAAVDAVGDLAVSGNDDLFTMTTFKLSGSTGAPLWGPVTLASASAGTVAVATNGDVAASGVIILSGSNLDFVTIRYKSSDGSVLWGPVTTDSPAHGLDEPFGLAFDASGNLVLGGSSQALNLNLDISLVKYDGATGATLWGPVYVGGPDDERLAGLNVRGDSIVVGATSEAGLLTAMLDESLGIQATGPALPPAFCGQAYAFPFVAQNGSPAYTWSIVSGTLPDGLTLSPGGSLAGTPTAQGTFTFTVRVTDSTLAQRERAFTLVVTEDPGDVAILALPAPSCHYTLAVPPGFLSYLWLPSGETTSTIDVSPVERTTYGVIVGDGTGCFLHLSVTLGGTALQDRRAWLRPSPRSPPRAGPRPEAPRSPSWARSSNPARKS